MPWRLLWVGLAASAAAIALAWLAMKASWPDPWRVIGPTLAAVLAALGAWRWPAESRGTLRWTGHRWLWCDSRLPQDEQPVTVRLAMDLHEAALVQLVPVEGTGRRSSWWLLLRRGDDPARWSQCCATLLAARPVAPGPA